MKEINVDSPDFKTRSMLLNVGPSHPAMHGTVKIIVELDGEVIRKADVDIGYLHRAFEKHCESGNWTQAIPYVDRLNYVSPLINNFAYAQTVEKLLGIDVTERCKYIRVLLSEISRVCDHLTCVGASTMELGAFSVFLYMIKAREYLWELIQDVTGARVTISYARVGGVKADLPEGFIEKSRLMIGKVREVLGECDALITANRIFYDRMRHVGVITKEDAISYGITGPFLRSTGVAYDVRKAQPHWVYDRVRFDVPVGTVGDNYDRYLVRMEEMRQSLRIIEQCLQEIPAGPLNVDETGKVVNLDELPAVLPAARMADLGKFGQTEGLKQREPLLEATLEGGEGSRYAGINVAEKNVVLPPKRETYSNIEALMNHFKLVMLDHGIRPPKGEAYFCTEGGNGELGFYIVSDGSDRPWRVRVHPPCFPIMAALGQLLVGSMVADVVPTFGSVNMIGGELDR